MPEHIIKNYEQVKAHLAKLSRDHNRDTAGRDYNFAIGDLFNENIPPHSQYGDTGGISAAAYNRALAREVDHLLRDTDTDLARSTVTTNRYIARQWPRAKRTAKCAFGVYKALAPHPNRFSLISDGMTVSAAAALAAGRASDEQRERRRLYSRTNQLKVYNRTQTLRIGINCLRSIGTNDDGTPLTAEQIALIGEAYAVLDAYCDRKGIDMSEPPLAGVA